MDLPSGERVRRTLSWCARLSPNETTACRQLRSWTLDTHSQTCSNHRNLTHDTEYGKFCSTHVLFILWSNNRCCSLSNLIVLSVLRRQLYAVLFSSFLLFFFKSQVFEVTFGRVCRERRENTDVTRSFSVVDDRCLCVWGKIYTRRTFMIERKRKGKQQTSRSCFVAACVFMIILFLCPYIGITWACPATCVCLTRIFFFVRPVSTPHLSTDI